jgi:NAD(P)-dependent dehydrogenase (short-subunit alcohol dehydrogenase family)
MSDRPTDVTIFAGAGGIATATAARLGSRGARLIIGDRRLDAATAAAEVANAAGGQAVPFEFNLSDEKSIGALIDAALETFGRIDGLFNVAADVAPSNLEKDTDALDISLDVWEHTLDVNLTGYLLTIRAALPHILAQGGGPILNTISGAAYIGEPTRVAYAVSKAGVSALTRHVARRWGKEGVRCNSIAPGVVLTETAKETVGDELLSQLLEGLPTSRHGMPDDIGAMAALLLSDDGEWINGQSFGIDGGLTMR